MANERENVEASIHIKEHFNILFAHAVFRASSSFHNTYIHVKTSQFVKLRSPIRVSTVRTWTEVMFSRHSSIDRLT